MEVNKISKQLVLYFAVVIVSLYFCQIHSFKNNIFNHQKRPYFKISHIDSTNNVLSMVKSTTSSSNSGGSNKKKSSSSKSQHKKILPPQAEFSRIVNAGQIPPNGRPVLCRIIAKEKERIGLAKRFDIDNLIHFSANITLTRRDYNSILVKGNFEAQMKVAELVPPEVLTADFDTLLLDNSGNGGNSDMDSFVDFNTNMDYDDEIGNDGSIDIGEIASQYLSLEM